MIRTGSLDCVLSKNIELESGLVYQVYCIEQGWNAILLLFLLHVGQTTYQMIPETNISMHDV